MPSFTRPVSALFRNSTSSSPKSTRTLEEDTVCELAPAQYTTPPKKGGNGIYLEDPIMCKLPVGTTPKLNGSKYKPSNGYGMNGGAREFPKPSVEYLDDNYEYDISIKSRTKTTVVKETTTTVIVECRKHLASKADDILLGTPTCHSLLEYIAVERLRSMPHQGSSWDKVLKWVENFAKRVDDYTYTIGGFTSHSFEGTKLIYGSCRMLLRMGIERVRVLEKVFGVLNQMSSSLEFFLRQKHLFSASVEIQTILAHAYSDLLSFIFDVTIRYRKTADLDLSQFDHYFGAKIDSFFCHKDSFTSEVWTCSLHESSVTTSTTITVRTIREWLASHDRTLEIFLSDRLGTRTRRYDYTCEWFESTLKDFQRGREDLLWVTGESGCGKSVLAGWILERLRRTSHLRTGYDVISFTINPYLKTQRSTMAVVKGLLLQLLERSVGDISLYKVLSALYERAEKRGVTDNLEAAMWKAFDEALNGTGRLMMVIDGLDQLEGGDKAVHQLAERLHGLSTKHQGMKCILMSRPVKSVGFKCGQFYIEEKHNHVDIASYITVKLRSTREFRSLKDEEKRIIIETVTKSSRSTFIWAKFCLELLKTEKTVQGMLDCLGKLPTGLPDLLKRLCHRLDFNSADTRLIISFLIAAERPLTIAELKTLFEIDVRTCSRSSRLSSIEEDIFAACGSLVTVRDGLVCFSHSSIKEYLVNLCNSDDFPLTVHDAHKEIVVRSLGYLKICLKGQDAEPKITVCYDASALTKKHRFFEYATRYWLTHFKHSSMYSAKGKHTFSTEFKTCFPDSAVLALIEGSWWENQTCASDAFEMHSLALTLRKLCLGEKHKIVIQCYLNMGKTFSTKSTSCDYYYRAWEITKTTCGEHHEVTRACAKAYLEITERTVTTRTEVIIKRTETVTRYIYTSSKHIHGECHEETIRYGKALAEILVTLKRIEESLTILREVRKACIEVYGELHEETMSTTTTLTTVLTKTTTRTSTTTVTEEVTTITKSILEVCEKTLQVWEERRITATVKMVEVYESKKEWKLAEELLLSLRRQIIEVCKHEHSDHVHEAKIEITLQYVRFLKRHSRDKEAEKIIIELWGEFKDKLQDKDCAHGEGLLIRIRIIGEEMKKWKIVAVAESVFSTLWGFYKKTSKSGTREGTSIAVLLAGTLRIREDHHSEETILKEIFEASITRTTVDITVVKTCMELSSFYEREERWEEAIHVCKSTLFKIWSSLVSYIEVTKGDVCGLPSTHYHEAIEIARRLAICYYREGRIHEAESVYLFILSACRTSLELHDELILFAVDALVEFYTSIGKIEIAIEKYHELFEIYREVLGVSHEITIKITYKLATYCKHHAPRKAERYYVEIITCSHSHEEVITSETIEATLTLCHIYERDRKFTEAIRYYGQLWDLFCRRGHGCGMTVETILEIYHKYVKLETRVEVVYEITVQFREACIKYYGKYHFITIKATIELARILERDESRQQEAITIYEEIRTIISEHSELKVVISETVIIDIKKRLAHLYACHSHSVSKAEVIYFESWEITRKRHGYCHEESLSRLWELVMFFKKQGTKECIETATTTISTTVIEIITKERDTQKLYNSAVKIAQLYIELGLTEMAWEYIREIRSQLASVEVTTSKTFGFSLRKSHTVDRRSFVFVVAFEQCLKGSITSHTYAEIIQDFLTESSLFEAWMRTLQYGDGFEASLTIGSRLRRFLISKGRDGECAKITDELWKLFLDLANVEEKDKKKGIIYDLFITIVHEMGAEDSDVSVLDAGATAVTNNYNRANFDGAYELANWVFKYVMNHGGFCEERNFSVGFKLAICMAGREGPKCADKTLAAQMMGLSKTILTEVLKASEKENLSFANMKVERVNMVIILLGDQKNYKAMERILRSLWHSRQTQSNWSPDTIVSIGVRLSEVLFALNRKAEAIELIHDIAYNLRRVWGDLDASTVRCFNLLSAFYTTEGAYAKSQQLHNDVITRGLRDDNENQLAEDAEAVIREQVRRLKRSFERHGDWHAEVNWERTQGEVAFHFEKAGEGWGKWKPGAKALGEEDLGVWKAPISWGFLDASKKVTHGWSSASGGGVHKRGSRHGSIKSQRSGSNRYHHHHHHNGVAENAEEEEEEW